MLTRLSKKAKKVSLQTQGIAPSAQMRAHNPNGLLAAPGEGVDQAGDGHLNEGDAGGKAGEEDGQHEQEEEDHAAGQRAEDLGQGLEDQALAGEGIQTEQNNGGDAREAAHDAQQQLSHVDGNEVGGEVGLIGHKAAVGHQVTGAKADGEQRHTGRGRPQLNAAETLDIKGQIVVQTLGDAVEREHADVDDQQDNEQGGKQDLAALLNALLDAAETDQGGQDDNGENDGIDQGAVCVNLVVVPLNVVQERSAADGGTMYTAQMAMTTG